MSRTDEGTTTPTGHVELRAVASLCAAGDCPTVYVTDRDTVVVQGYPLGPDAAHLTIPTGEGLVEIPRSLLSLAARHLAGS